MKIFFQNFQNFDVINDVVRAKIGIALALLKWGLSVLISDADVVWLRNPWPFILKASTDADVVAQLDAPFETKWSSFDPYVNSGCVFIKHGNTGVS